MVLKNYINYTESTPSRGSLYRAFRAAGGAVLSPLYWALAHFVKTPGLNIHAAIVWLGISKLPNLLRLDHKMLYGMLFFPIFSTRYFEFDFVWKGISRKRPKNYLDVSSPRFMPLLVAQQFQVDIQADMLNPDHDDLPTTIRLGKALGMPCTYHNCLIEDFQASPESYDLITCVSVLEHIIEDSNALAQMWALLKPGGTLLLTLPCQAREMHEFINNNHYGLIKPDTDGYVFFQYLYDQDALKTRIFSVVGEPIRVQVYGEKNKGYLRDILLSNTSGSTHPFWKTPYNIGKNCQYYASIDDLPGEGVIGLEFRK